MLTIAGGILLAVAIIVVFLWLLGALMYGGAPRARVYLYDGNAVYRRWHVTVYYKKDGKPCVHECEKSDLLRWCELESVRIREAVGMPKYIPEKLTDQNLVLGRRCNYRIHRVEGEERAYAVSYFVGLMYQGTYSFHDTVADAKAACERCFAEDQKDYDAQYKKEGRKRWDIYGSNFLREKIDSQSPVLVEGSYRVHHVTEESQPYVLSFSVGGESRVNICSFHDSLAEAKAAVEHIQAKNRELEFGDARRAG